MKYKSNINGLLDIITTYINSIKSGVENNTISGTDIIAQIDRILELIDKVNNLLELEADDY